jgi:hypothetical protein
MIASLLPWLEPPAASVCGCPPSFQAVWGKGFKMAALGLVRETRIKKARHSQIRLPLVTGLVRIFHAPEMFIGKTSRVPP